MSELLQAQKYAKPFIQKILRRSLEDVEDVLQQAALDAHKHMNSFRGTAKFSTWFTRIAINRALMSVRGQKEKNTESLDILHQNALVSHEESPEEFVIRIQREELIRKRVHKAIRLLNPRRRHAVYRWLHEEKMLNGAEKAMRHAAKVRLKEILEQKEKE